MMWSSQYRDAECRQEYPARTSKAYYCSFLVGARELCALFIVMVATATKNSAAGTMHCLRGVR